MKTKKSLGSALILTTILLFVILGMVVSLTYVTVMEQKMSGKTKSSVGSFYSAESGVEWVLNKIATSSETTIAATFSSLNTDGSVNCPDSFGEDSCKVYLLDQDGKVLDPATDSISQVKAVRSVGSQGGETQRAIEAAVAATGGGCYISYAAPPGLTDSTGKCLQGFTNKGSAGQWGYCSNSSSAATGYAYLLPPGGSCDGSYISFIAHVYSEAFICCLD